MKIRPGTWKLAAFGLLAGAVLLVVACGGVSQADLDAAKAQLATEQLKTAALQKEVSTRIGELTTLQQQVTAAKGDTTKLQEQVTAKEKEIVDLNKAAGALQGVTVLIGAKAVPTPTPRPTPTPPPAGFVPPPPAKPDAAFLNEVVPFAFYVETLATSGVSTYGLISFPYCVPNSQFKRGTILVWRFEVFDTSTGKRVTGEEGAKVEIVLPHGEKITPRYTKRGGIGPWMWGGAFTIPLDYPLGTFDYQIVVTAKDGRTGTFDQDKVALVRPASATAVAIDSRVQILP